ncbi:Hypothetical predicted protein [Octopus vulgaris]|uniref:Uncharacterized protein n=1 Tax=Octopus vulgaris TaxID=6645 RepID=A0AA36AQP0_OCTVU|nr:Hypothetical predicted protein [Octopus vulgaris]
MEAIKLRKEKTDDGEKMGNDDNCDFDYGGGGGGGGGVSGGGFYGGGGDEKMSSQTEPWKQCKSTGNFIRSSRFAQRLAPMKASHSLGYIPYTESDSGFSSSYQTKSNSASKLDEFQPSTLTRSSSLSQLNNWASEMRHSYSNSRLNRSFCSFESNDPILKELRDCLEDSENRRTNLIEKLKEAQKTLQGQSDRLSKIEITSKGNSSMLNELKKKELDYKKKLLELEKMKTERSQLKIEKKRLTEEMQQRLDNVQTQLQTLQSRYQICQKENEKRMKLLEQSTDAIKMVEEENYKLIREKGKIKAESDIYKESLGTLQLKCTLLEEKNKTLEKDISTVKEEYFIYKSYTEKIEEKLIKETEQARLYYDENKYLADGYKSLEEDKELISKQLKHCENSLSDLQSQLAVIRTEKDLFQEELNGEKLKLHDINTSKEELIKENTQLQKKINTLQYDANTKELAISSYKNDYRKLEEEYSAVKKVCEDLSGELCTLKASYEEKMEKLNLLESNTSLVIQEHQLIQKERKSKTLSCQPYFHTDSAVDAPILYYWFQPLNISRVTNNKNISTRGSLESKKHDHLNEREKQEEIIDKLKTEIDHKDESWSQLKGRCHHLDQELVKTKEKLTHSVSNQKEELFGWKNTCERLTEALNRKENEIQTLTDRCRDLDETTLQLKLEIHSYKDQISTLRSQQQLFHRLKEENRRLLKEKVENEQLIKLLETEKEVLTKNTNREIKCSQRDLAKMEQDLDHANQVNQELKVANEVLTEKINSSQNENQELKEALTESSKMVSAEDHDGLNASHKDLLVEYKQLKEAYLRLVDKEESSQNVNDLSNQLGDINTELERLKVENENLLSQKQKWEATQTTDVDSCRLELEQTKEELEQQRVANELLKKESLADVDKDLQQMRQELHQLMGVIRNKDQEIENLGSQLKSSQSQIQTCEETIQQLKTSLNDLKSKEPVDAPVTATTNSSTMAPLTINTDKTTSSKENGDVFSPLEPVAENENSLKQIMEDYPSVTLRSASVTDSLSSVDAASKSSDVPLSPNSDRLHSLIAKYRNPGDAPASPDRGRVSGRPHSIGPGSSFSGMSRILGLTTPKPFYLSSGGAKFNRMSGTSSALSGGPSSTSSEPGTDLPPLATSTTSSMPSSSFLQSVNSKGELTKTSPSSFPKSPPVPPPRPASRPSSVHSPVQDVQAVALNGNTETRSASPKLLPKPQQRQQQQQQPQQQPKEQQPEPESVANNDIEEVRANMIVDV